MTSLPDVKASIFNADLYRSVLDVWYEGHPSSSTAPNLSVLGRWFGMNVIPEQKEAFDYKCRSVAGNALDFLCPERLPLGHSTCEGLDDNKAMAYGEAFYRLITGFRNLHTHAKPDQPPLTHCDLGLALILLLDQMSRNIFRHSADQWRIYSHYDCLARALTRVILTGTQQNAGQAMIPRLNLFESIINNPSRRLWFYLPLEHPEQIADHDKPDELVGELMQACEQSHDVDAVKFLGMFQ